MTQLRTLGWLPRDGATADPLGREPSIGRPGGPQVVIGRHGNPAVRTAEDPGGSFAVVDGELYGDDGPLGDAAEVVLRDVQRLGAAAAARWHAEAATAVWDAARRTLVLTRDRMGITPIYWSVRSDGVLWATEISALLDAGVPRELDPAAVDTFIATGRVPAPWTFLRSVRKVPPGHALVVEQGREPRLELVWRQTGTPKTDDADGPVADRLAAALEVAVRRRAGTSTGELGALLSGGVDSTLLVAVATKLLGLRPRTFTFHYLDYDGPFNEDAAASARAAHFGTEHERIDVDPRVVAERFGSIVSDFGEPFTYGLHTFLLGRAAARGVTALLSGAGPDGWYFSARAARLALALRRLPLAPGRSLTRASEALTARWFPAHRIERLLVHGVDGMHRNYVLATTRERARLHLDPRRAVDGQVALRGVIDATSATYAGESPVDRDIFTEQRCFSAEHMMFWNHRWGRVHGIAIRHPYFDNDVHDLVAHLRRDGEDKEDVRQVAERLMPVEFARSPKVFQSIPVGTWLRGPLRPFLEERLSPARVAASGLFRVDEISRLVAEHTTGAKNNDWVLWSLLTLLEWQETALGGAGYATD